VEEIMYLSERLSHVAAFIPKCKCIADIGTDHGYIPIYAVNNGLCETALACDIKYGPVKVAQNNIIKYSLEDKITTRVGNGLSVLKKGEADVIVIAGLGGNIISEVLENDIDLVYSADCLILQPVQYYEVLRKKLITLGLKIIDEDIVKENSKFYFILKVIKSDCSPFEKEVYYYTGTSLLEKREPLLKEYCIYKHSVFCNILKELSPVDQNVRYNEVRTLIQQFEDVIECLKL
jgi:tRNA (adenine22-N1)-methyltransferase